MAFSGIPNKGEQKQKCSPTKGNKIRSGCLTPTFPGGPKEGGSATSPPRSRGPLQKGSGPRRAPGKNPIVGVLNGGP